MGIVGRTWLFVVNVLCVVCIRGGWVLMKATHGLDDLYGGAMILLSVLLLLVYLPLTFPADDDEGDYELLVPTP